MRPGTWGVCSLPTSALVIAVGVSATSKPVATVCKVAVKRQAEMSCESLRLDSSQLPIYFTPL